MRFPSASAAFLLMAGGLLAVSTVAARAEDIGVSIEQARAANAKGDLLHALTALQSAQDAAFNRLSDQFSKVMPGALSGWQAEAAEGQSLGGAGGGLTVTRGYTKGDATLVASVVVDNPAVADAVSQSKQPPQKGWAKVKIGNDDAMERFDTANRSGEIILLVADRAVLQIEGNEIAKDDILIEAAKGWNIPAIRKIIGVP